MRELIAAAEGNMKKTIAVVQKDFASLRAGRATPALLDKILVDYYGTPTPINQLASISVPEARMLVVQPWDKGAIGEVERAIMKSDLGINPINDGNVIRLKIPELTQERRQELVRLIRKRAEEGRVAVRNIRRETMDQMKARQKDGVISEDELRRSQDEVQKLTDRQVKEIDALVAAKEKEIMEI